MEDGLLCDLIQAAAEVEAADISAADEAATLAAEKKGKASQEASGGQEGFLTCAKASRSKKLKTKNSAAGGETSGEASSDDSEEEEPSTSDKLERRRTLARSNYAQQKSYLARLQLLLSADDGRKYSTEDLLLKTLNFISTHKMPSATIRTNEDFLHLTSRRRIVRITDCIRLLLKDSCDNSSTKCEILAAAVKYCEKAIEVDSIE